MALLQFLRRDYVYILKVLLLGSFSGFPQIFVFSLLTLWLKSAGISNTEIAAIGAITFFYAFNWMIAPLADRYRGLGLDRRRFWLVLSQAVMCLAGLFLWHLDIRTQMGLVIIGVLVIAFASAVQDVSIDALRIELTPPDRQDLLIVGASCATVGWYSGFYLGAALGLKLFSYWSQGVAAPLVWAQVYGWLALLFPLIIVLTMTLYRPQYGKPEVLTSDGNWLETVLIKPFSAFVEKNGLKTFIMVLAFVFLFKIGEAFLGRMAMVFYKEVGFSEDQIANYVKIIGWVVISVFSLVSSFLAMRFGVWRGLMIGGIAMASTNLLYAVLALAGPSVPLLIVTVVSDQFTSAFATVSFVAFLSALCDRHYTASQYALFASVGNGARILLASASGFMLDHWLGGNWAVFFVITAIMALPGLILLWRIRHMPVYRRSLAKE